MDLWWPRMHLFVRGWLRVNHDMCVPLLLVEGSLTPDKPLSCNSSSLSPVNDGHCILRTSSLSEI